MKRALVTGGCGFVGSSVVRALLQRDVAVRVLALPAELTANVDGLDVEVVRGDVLRRQDCEAAVRDVDTVFHVAAVYKAWVEDPTQMYAVSLRGTFNVLEAARRAGVEKVVYTASIVSLGRPDPGLLADERTPYEAWGIDFAYSRAKYHGRELAEDFAAWGLDVRVVCPGVVLGPRDAVPTPSGKLILELLGGKGPPVYTGGGASYVDVRDAAEVHVLAAEKGSAGERYVATAHNLSSLELIEAVHRAAGTSVRGMGRRFVRVPEAVAQGVVTLMEGRARRSRREPPLTRAFLDYSLKPAFFSNEKARRELGATFRPLEQTLADAIAYFTEHGMLRQRRK